MLLNSWFSIRVWEDTDRQTDRQRFVIGLPFCFELLFWTCWLLLLFPACFVFVSQGFVCSFL
jgi:hypothetical protein